MQMQIRGKQLHVEVMGDEHPSALLYLHGGPGGMGCLDFMVSQATEVWANSGRTRALILAEGTIYQSIIPRLSDLAMPALLMKGEHDPITCDKQVDAFKAHVPHGRIERFSASGHWIRYEESGRYTATVVEFLSLVGG